MRHFFLYLCTTLIFGCTTTRPLLESDAPAQVRTGTLDLPELSGVGIVGDRLLVAADDPQDKKTMPFHMIAVLKDPWGRLRDGANVAVDPAEQIYRDVLRHARPDHPDDAKHIKDLEDVAVAPDGDVYLITSHSRSKGNDIQAERQHLLRLRFAPDGTLADAAIAKTKPQALWNSLPVDLADSTSRNPGSKNGNSADPGFNIEGLAWAPPRDLLLGLRSPLDHGRAIILRLENVPQYFTDHPADDMPLVPVATLDLAGQGIRGMCHDSADGGYWLLAGNSADPDVKPSLTDVWRIWKWNGHAGARSTLTHMQLPVGANLLNPEAICIVRRSDRGISADSLLLIGDADVNTPSPFLLVPLALLTPAN